jgi:hypothetical protein
MTNDDIGRIFSEFDIDARRAGFINVEAEDDTGVEVPQ